MDQFAVAGAVQIGSRSYTGDPQATKISLIRSPIPIGITKGAIYSLSGGTIETALATPVPFGHFQYFISSTAGLKPACYAWHGNTPVFFYNNKFSSGNTIPG